ncbi:MAG: SDR family NAD(P)-dependent oxidoreductase [Solirubrobacteraceae bacterium]
MSALAHRRVLVTGAGGFIGSHLVQALVAEGARVRAFVHYNSRGDWGNLSALPVDALAEVDVVAGEIQDPFSVSRAVAGCEAVFHLAALIGIPYSYLAPKSYVDTNILGTLNVLQAALEHGVQRVLQTSTSETYGTALYSPIPEEHPLQGQSPYSASKIGADKLAESYWRSMDLAVTTVRPFNTFGPRQSLRAVIPTIIGQAIAGHEVMLGSLEPVRDFTYVTDTAAAFIAAASSADTVGLTLNVGNGKGITIGALARMILELLGSEAQVLADAQRVRPQNSEVFHLLCDSRRLRELTGWAPAVSLEEGLRRTIAWWEASQPLNRVRTYTV